MREKKSSAQKSIPNPMNLVNRGRLGLATKERSTAIRERKITEALLSVGCSSVPSLDGNKKSWHRRQE
ncbi:hypothetical protein TNCV_3269471 [Trichonephila clavipes]|nr:hypothetical protein TNCV_3269471 [Trichonephila clavipes]